MARVSRSLTAIPADAASYRSDRLIGDVVDLQDHVDLDRADLLGHSAGANVAVQFAAGHPDRVSRLVLITPSTRAVVLETNADAALAFGAPSTFDPNATARRWLPSPPRFCCSPAKWT